MAQTGEPAVPTHMPHTLDIKIPLPPGPLSSYIMRSVSVDPELSKDSVHRTLSCSQDMLEIHYSAKTARMLRVAVNGVLESVRLCIRVAAELSPEVLSMDLDEV